MKTKYWILTAAIVFFFIGYWVSTAVAASKKPKVTIS